MLASDSVNFVKLQRVTLLSLRQYIVRRLALWIPGMFFFVLNRFRPVVSVAVMTMKQTYFIMIIT